MTPSDAGQSGEFDLTQRLLAAMTDSPEWQDQARLVVELWLVSAGASSAVLLSPTGPDRIEVCCCRTSTAGSFHTTTVMLEAPFSSLLNIDSLIQLVAEAGLIGGIRPDVFQWLDLAAVLLVQLPETLVGAEKEELCKVLISAARQLLTKAVNRPLQTPHVGTLEAMAEFAAGAGHEINNPLASIVGQTQLLLKNESSAERRQAFETIGAQAWRIRDMIGNAMLFARPPQPQLSRFNLVDVARKTLQPLTTIAIDDRIEIKLASTSDVIELEADQSQLQTLIAHFVRNSLDAITGTGRAGKIVVTLRDDQPGAVEISFTDDGPGLATNETQQHLFNPFYSGRSAGRGLGFGLCIAWQIARIHGGMIIHERDAAEGTVFHVALPTSSTSPASAGAH